MIKPDPTTTTSPFFGVIAGILLALLAIAIPTILQMAKSPISHASEIEIPTE